MGIELTKEEEMQAAYIAGTIIGKNSNIYPLSSVIGVVPENSIYKCKNEIVEKNKV